ncbi:MAG: glucose-1-phosphate adenylyltransferase subunit GlgD [Lachnospiraceae bacterium]|jgi:glucose-1-phosphate adenylyltransferase|nr:glucose-1-phosphate adenylyltransferase subunit GlgD [Lachnospiraceae bacterium]
MINSNADSAMGILFPNSYDSLVPELVTERLMASIPFASRYRLVDFVLSSMVNCGIDNISLIVKRNYHSLMDHLGSGREWDLTRKKGGLNIIPPFAQKTVNIYNGRVEAIASIIDYLKRQKEKYVIMADTNIAVNFDFKDLLQQHIDSGADVTIAYTREDIPKALRDIDVTKKDLYYTLGIAEDGRVQKIVVNDKQGGEKNVSMNIYVIERELLMDQIRQAYVNGLTYFERDIISPQLDKLVVKAYRHDGYYARILDLNTYFAENMKMLKEENVNALFAPSPIYTKIRDDNPTRYAVGSHVKNVMAADGCVIEGEVENSILFRGVKIGKGAKVRNCVLMQDTVIETGATVEHAITDKNVRISSYKELKGTESFPVFVEKRKLV